MEWIAFIQGKYSTYATSKKQFLLCKFVVISNPALIWALSQDYLKTN